MDSKGNNTNKKRERIGERRKMNCGMYATIIAYRNSRNIDVQFEDGAIVQNRTYSLFKKGAIANKKKRIDERRKMNCGMYATIIAYRNSANIDVQFEDGTIVQNRAYFAFKKGTIVNQRLRKFA